MDTEHGVLFFFEVASDFQGRYSGKYDVWEEENRKESLQVRYEKGSLMGIRSVMTEKDLGLFDAADQVYHV